MWEEEARRPPCPNHNHYPGPLPWLWPWDEGTSGNINGKNFPEFIHIAKNGGATIQSVSFGSLPGGHLAGHFSIGKTRFDKRVIKSHKWGCKDGETPPRGVDNHTYHRQPTFCVVRHPLTHIVSSMNYASEPTRAGVVYGAEDHRAWMHDALREAVALLREEQRREHNPGFFPATLKNPDSFDPSIEALSAKHLFASQQFCHLLPQSDYVWDERGERTCNYVLRFEHLQEEFAALARLYGEEATDADGRSVLDREGVTQHHKTHDFTVDDMEPAVREALVELYAADFCLLGYSANASVPVAPLMSTERSGSRAFRRCAKERDRRVNIDNGDEKA